MPQSESPILGHLLRAGSAGFTVGTRADKLQQLKTPLFGSLCLVADGANEIYGIIAAVQIMDDGLVQQLVAEGRMQAETLADNRYNRNQPVEISVITLGYLQDGRLHPRLPGSPPLALQALRLCGPAEGLAFCQQSNFAYLRFILNQTEYPAQEIILAHEDQLNSWEPRDNHPDHWYTRLNERLILSLRNDYERLSQILDALSNVEQSWQ